MAIVTGTVVWEWSVVHELVIDCTLINATNTALYVFDPDPPYVLPMEDGRLLIAYTWIRVPEGLRVTIVEQAGVFELGPLAETRRTVRLGIPVHQAVAYNPIDVNREPIFRDSTSLQFLVGSTPKTDAVRLRPAWCHSKDVQTLDVPFEQQHVTLSQPFPLRVPMRIRPPVRIPFQPQPPDAAPVIVLAETREALSLRYKLRNDTRAGFFVAVPDKPVLTVENGTELHIRVAPPTAVPPGASVVPPVPAVFLPPEAALTREILLDQPVFSDHRPLVPFPADWRGRDVRTTAVRFTQAWWDDAVAAFAPGNPAAPPERLDVPPAGFPLQRTETFLDDEARVLLWRGGRA